MSNSEIMQKLMDEMSSDHAWYLGYIGVLVGLVIAFVGLIGYLQLRLSNKQIEKMKNDVKKDIHEEYPIEQFNKIKAMEQALSSVSQSRLFQFQQVLLESDRSTIESIYITTQRFVEELMSIEIVRLPQDSQEMLFMDLKQLVSVATYLEKATTAKEKHYALLLNNLFVSIHKRFSEQYGEEGYNDENGLFQITQDRINVFQKKQEITKD